MSGLRTLYQKIWDDHLVMSRQDGAYLLYVDWHLVHEVTSPQAFEGLRKAGRRVRRPKNTLAVIDHVLPTTRRDAPISDPAIDIHMATLQRNVK